MPRSSIRAAVSHVLVDATVTLDRAVRSIPHARFARMDVVTSPIRWHAADGSFPRDMARRAWVSSNRRTRVAKQITAADSVTADRAKVPFMGVKPCVSICAPRIFWPSALVRRPCGARHARRRCRRQSDRRKVPDAGRRFVDASSDRMVCKAFGLNSTGTGPAVTQSGHGTA